MTELLPFQGNPFLAAFADEQNTYLFGPFKVQLYGCATLAEIRWVQSIQDEIEKEEEIQVIKKCATMFLISRCPEIKADYQQYLEKTEHWNGVTKTLTERLGADDFQELPKLERDAILCAYRFNQERNDSDISLQNYVERLLAPVPVLKLREFFDVFQAEMSAGKIGGESSSEGKLKPTGAKSTGSSKKTTQAKKGSAAKTSSTVPSA